MRALVLNHERFAREVLGRWFKHQKFTSFVRQLNMYGFHKIPHLQQGVLKSDSDTEPWNFEHPHFHRGQPDLLCLIQRKKQPTNNNAEDGDAQDNAGASAAHAAASGQLLDVNSLVNGIAAIKRHQQAISADLQALKKSNEMLWEEATLARQRHDKHQDTINRILKFLAGVFGHSTDSLDQHDDPGHSPSVAPRTRQRLLIGDGRAGKGSKTVEVTDVADEEDDVLHSVHPQEGATLPLAGKFPYDLLQQLAYEVQQRVGQVSSVESPLMSPAPSSAPSEVFSPNIVESTPPGFAGRPTRPTEVLSRTNTNNTSNHGSTTDASARSTPTPRNAPPESTVAPSTLSTFAPNTTPSNLPDSAWQTAIQQVLNNPQQMQRLMQALATQPSFPIAPPPDSSYMQPQPVAQLTPYAPYDYNRFRPELPVATQVPPSTLPLLNQSIPAHDDGPSFDPLLENASRLQKSYRDAVEIEADMDVLQSSLNSLIHDLGMDPQSLTQNQERELQARQAGVPYLNGVGGMHPPDAVQQTGIRANGPTDAPMLNGYSNHHSDPSSDLFLESLLNNMGNGGDPNVDYTDVTDRFDPATRIDGTTVGDASTDQLTAFLDEVSDTASPHPITDSPNVTPLPQKRKSDVAGLSLPSSSPSNIVDHAQAGPKTKRKR